MSGDGPVVAVDLGVTSVAVSVDPTPADGDPAGLDPVDVGCAEGPVDLAAVFAPADGSALVTGHEARRRAAADPSRYEPTPRLRVDEGELLLGTRVVGVAEALGAVLAAALDRVGPLLRGGRPSLLVLTHPADWGTARRETLRRAGSGLADTVALLAEPVAAAAHAAWMRPDGAGWPAGAPLAVLDVGARAVAAAVVRGPDPSGAWPEAAVLAARTDDGRGAGAGDDADELLLAHVVDGLRDDDPAAARVREVVGGGTLPLRRFRQVLLDDVRAARERLSDAEQAPVPLPGRTTAAWCSRAELEDVLEPSVRRAVALLRETVAAAGTGPAALAGVWIVGGGARTPLLGALVHRELGRPATVAPEPRLTVARGALAAMRSRGSAPGSGSAVGPAAWPPVAPPLTPVVPADPPVSADPSVPARPVPPPAPEPEPAVVARRRAAAVALPDWPRSAPESPVDPPTDALPVVPAPPARATAGVRPRGRRRAAAVAAVAAVVVALLGVVALVRAGAGAPVPDPDTGGEVVAFSHRYALPPGWVPAGDDDAARRSRIRPADAPTGPDLVAVQEDRVGSTDPAVGRARIVARYDAARAGGQQVSDLDVAAQFGGRPVVHYVQVPAPGTAVDWYVVFSGPLQLSVGCRYDAAGRARVAQACATVVAGLGAD